MLNMLLKAACHRVQVPGAPGMPLCLSQPPAHTGVDELTCSWSRPQGEKVKGRVLILADGATSKLATAMGYCTEAPKGVCSRAYVEGGTHNTKFDGVHPECKI